MSTPELHVAVFGASGAGKTVLLPAFFRAQTQPGFQDEYGYEIQAADRAQGSALLGRFFKLEDGRFPDSSLSFDDYIFDFFIRCVSQPALRVHWYDYPGKWWEVEPEDAEERAAMQDCLLRLGRSQVGILIADGAKYKVEGIRYIKWLLKHFADECARLQKFATQSTGGDVEFPREWILALSKADLFPSSYTANDFQREVCKDAAGQLCKLSSKIQRRSISAESKGSAFGHRFMLLSSVAMTNGSTIDPHTSIGVRTLAPAILMSTIEGAAHEAQERAKDKSLGESILDGLRGLVRLIDSIDNFLPKKYQVITMILKVIPIEDLLNAKFEAIKKARDKAIKKGDAFKAVVNGMAVAMATEEAKRAYFRNQ